MVRFESIDDILSVKMGDVISRSDRYRLFTGNKVGNTPQKGINWLGKPPNFDLVIIRCSLASNYSDRWISESEGVFIYHLMAYNRGTSDAKINYSSKENTALLNQNEHGAPVLLMIDKGRDSIEVMGRFEVIRHHNDIMSNGQIDSVILKRMID